MRVLAAQGRREVCPLWGRRRLRSSCRVVSFRLSGPVGRLFRRGVFAGLLPLLGTDLILLVFGVLLGFGIALEAPIDERLDRARVLSTPQTA